MVLSVLIDLVESNDGLESFAICLVSFDFVCFLEVPGKLAQIYLFTLKLNISTWFLNRLLETFCQLRLRNKILIFFLILSHALIWLVNEWMKIRNSFNLTANGLYKIAEYCYNNKFCNAVFMSSKVNDSIFDLQG